MEPYGYGGLTMTNKILTNSNDIHYFDCFWLKYSGYARRWYVAEYWKAIPSWASGECRNLNYHANYRDALTDLRSRVSRNLA